MGLGPDRRFIDGLGHDTDDTTIVEAIIRMAAGLRLDVVAEGIETSAQATILDAMGCRNGQGSSGRVRSRPSTRPRCSTSRSPRNPARHGGADV